MSRMNRLACFMKMNSDRVVICRCTGAGCPCPCEMICRMRTGICREEPVNAFPQPKI